MQQITSSLLCLRVSWHLSIHLHTVVICLNPVFQISPFKSIQLYRTWFCRCFFQGICLKQLNSLSIKLKSKISHNMSSMWTANTWDEKGLTCLLFERLRMSSLGQFLCNTGFEKTISQHITVPGQHHVKDPIAVGCGSSRLTMGTEVKCLYLEHEQSYVVMWKHCFVVPNFTQGISVLCLLMLHLVSDQPFWQPDMAIYLLS